MSKWKIRYVVFRPEVIQCVSGVDEENLCMIVRAMQEEPSKYFIQSVERVK